MAELNFDATQVSPEFGYETIPAGWYNAMIDESEMKPTKDGAGAYLQVRFSVIDGQYANIKIFMRLNLRNSNPVAQEIAFKQLSAISHAIGVLQVQDSSQLHGIPMKIKVKLRKDPNGQYEDANEISSVKNINEQVDVGQTAPNAMQQAPANWGTAPQPSRAPQQTMPMQQQPQQQSQQLNAPPVWQQPPQNSQPWQQPAQQPQAPIAAPTPASQPAYPANPAQQAPAQSAMPPWMQQPNR